MRKPKNWDLLSPIEQEAWRVKRREADRKQYEANREKHYKKCNKWRAANRERVQECVRKYREANREKRREQDRKYYAENPGKEIKRVYKAKQKAKNQSAADQFFIMAGAAEQLTKLKPKQ